MVAEASKYKTSEELMNIAHEMLVTLNAKHVVTSGEIAMIICLMCEEFQYLNQKEVIRKMVNNAN